MIKSILLLAFMLLPLAWAPAAQADLESWQAVEVRIPTYAKEPWMPVAFKSYTIAQEALRVPAIKLIRFSNGPLWQITPQFSIGAYVDLLYLQIQPDHPNQELRFNLEPVYRWRWGENWQLSERLRAEYRLLTTQQSVRLRNQLRVNWVWDTESSWSPFFADEVFYEFPGGFNQNRAMLGISQNISPNLRLDIAYMARSLLSGDQWGLDHILTLMLFYSPD